MVTVRTALWFDGTGAAAARFYTGLIPGSAIETPLESETTEPLVVNFHLAGVPYQAINGGPMYKASPAASIAIATADQAETDHYWAALTEGGAESRCGWCVDRFGLSWQVVPADLPRYLGGPDPAGAARARNAMLAMRKLDIEALRLAYEG